MRKELRSTISFAASHKVEIDRLSGLIMKLAAEGRGAFTHHTSTKEYETAKRAKLKLRLQDELCSMLYDQNARLEKDLNETLWQTSTVTTLQDELKPVGRLVDGREVVGIVTGEKAGEEAALAEASSGQSNAGHAAAGVSLRCRIMARPRHGHLYGTGLVPGGMGRLLGQPSAPRRGSQGLGNYEAHRRRRKKSAFSQQSESSSLSSSPPSLPSS